MKSKEINKMGIEELNSKHSELREKYSVEYVKTKVGSKTEKAVNLRNVRKDIARVLTAISQKKKEGK